MNAVILYLALGLASAGAQHSSPMKSMTGCDEVCGIAPEPGGGEGGDDGAGGGGDGGEGDDYYDYAESERVSAANGSEASVTEEDTRIVNGYEPDDRPWIAYIDVKKGLCGGAILTKLWVPLQVLFLFAFSSDPINY